MNLVEVSVPKSAKPMCHGAPALALQLGRREGKVEARLIADDLARFKGKTVICEATASQARNSKGDPIPVVLLKPTRRVTATHDTPFWNGSQIVIPAMQD
jgi:hypothetical protein